MNGGKKFPPDVINAHNFLTVAGISTKLCDFSWKWILYKMAYFRWSRDH